MPQTPNELRASGLIPDTHVLVPVELVHKLVEAAWIAQREVTNEGFGDAAQAASNILCWARKYGNLNTAIKI